MAEPAPARVSPLAAARERLERASVDGPRDVRAAEVPFLAQFDVRVDADAVPALALPTGPNTATTAGERRVLWLGPDEWLVVAPAGERGTLAGELRAALDGVPAAVVDVSGQRTVIELSGPSAREVLMKGCSIDLHPRAFGAGRCAQTALALAPVVLLPVRADAFWIFVRASFAEYLADWLIDAMREYRAPAGPRASTCS
jgi:sarcosine oxidase subunit gamma